MKIANKKLNKEITERKRAEEQLMLFLQCADNSPDGMAMGDTKGRITYVNKAFAGMFGYSREEMIGKEIAAIYAEDQIPKLKEALKTTMQGAWSGELVAKRKDGQLFTVEVSSSATTNDDGEVIAHMTSHKNIAERKRAEKTLKKTRDELELRVEQRTDELKKANEELRDSRMRYRSIFESVKDTILIFNLDGVIQEANSAACEMYGYPYDKLIGLTGKDIVHPDYLHLFKDFKETVKAGNPFSAESVDVRRDGSPINVEVRGTQFTFQAKPHLLAVLRDITERKKAEQALQKAHDGLELKVNQRTAELKKTNEELQREITERKRAEEALEVSNHNLTLAVGQLEEANRELKDFVYIASHDLREPLRKIYSFGELLKGSLENKLDGDDKENLDFMIDGANRMTVMIEGLLTYSRVGTKGKQFGTVDLSEIVEQLEQLELAKLLEETGGTIEVPQPLPIVEADAVQMRQLLQNLIANGIKYRRKEVKPQIVISAKNTDGNKVRIKVKDNGIGIDDKYHEDIFKMFRRLHSREEYGGAGIGLAVCKRIVDRHNGWIGVESNPGEGTTFWFTLSPANETAAVS